MKILIVISFLLLSALASNEICNIDEHGIEVCQDSNVITRINNTRRHEFCFLYLENNTTIGSNVFKDSNISELSLILPEYHSPSMLSLQPDVFVGLENLTTLQITDGNISYTGNPWSELKNLRSFSCIRCGFTEVPIEILASLPNLEKLVLAGNDIHRVRRSDFANMKNLTSLSLERNGEMDLGTGCFSGANNLRYLDLSHNSFHLAPGAFDGLTELLILDMFEVLNSDLHQPKAFQGMPALTRLQLSDGHLESLNPGMFDGLVALHSLRLNNNKLRHIPKGVFNKLSSLDDLSFTENNITTIEPGAFSELDLERLDLSGNVGLQVIETGTFDGLSTGYLGLHFCNISELRPSAFTGLNAQALDLGNNQLRVIGAEDFAGLQSRMLILYFNNVSEIASGAFSNTSVERIIIDEELADNPNKSDWGLSESVEIS
ncbi:leucine-rich repeat-containing protein 15-like [Diachasmimorpha longicaudata]|uniref:leucine-rich repeat-containing protein 15-like n=1 Tax=Diachasmimorpha longicaudata TaxID=58733 RepID=UPI0030B90005